MLSAWLRWGGIFDVPTKEKRINELETISQADTFWDSPEDAQRLLKERSDILDELTQINSLESKLGDLGALIELFSEGSEEELAEEFSRESDQTNLQI